ncbi:MAG: ATP-binding protein [Sphaerochaetaceae bacterium]
MKLIQRDLYLNQLKSVKGTPDIKVITGVRRSGKSKLMEAFISYLGDTEPESNIISVNYGLDDTESLMEYHALNEYIKGQYAPDTHNYVFIDEVQMCNGFEKVINWLHSSEKYDIYITGSNAFLLSSDLATLFTGRTYAIEVFPFSFKEYMEYFKLDNKYDAFSRYMKEGGMAGSYVYNEEQKYNYLADIFSTLILRDIKQKYKLRNNLLLKELADFLLDNISNLTSARSITDELKKRNTKVDHKTVSKYISYLCNAFAFYTVQRYDMKGKKYLSSQQKYYLCDHSLKYAVLGTKNLDYGGILENIVAIELLRCGYQVYAGVLYKKEIDFVAIRRNEKLYIQVAASIEDKTTFERETAPLLRIRDGYPRILITRTGYDDYDIEGIKVTDAANWLQRT